MYSQTSVTVRPRAMPHAAFSELAHQMETLRENLSGRQAAGDTVLVRTGAVCRAAPQKAGLPYHAAADEAQASGDSGGDQVTATAIPYLPDVVRAAAHAT